MLAFVNRYYLMKILLNAGCIVCPRVHENRGNTGHSSLDAKSQSFDEGQHNFVKDWFFCMFYLHEYILVNTNKNKIVVCKCCI